MSDCQHEFVEDGTCLLCGLAVALAPVETVGYSRQHQRPRAPPSRHLPEVDLKPEVRSWIVEHLNTETLTKPLPLFVAIYLAHLHLGLDFKPEGLARQLGLKRSELEAATKMAAASVPVVVVSPLKAVSTACEELGTDAAMAKDITTFTHQLLEKHPLLLEDNPQRVAAGIIRYSYEKHGLEVSTLARALGLSGPVIRKYRDLVAQCAA